MSVYSDIRKAHRKLGTAEFSSGRDIDPLCSCDGST